MEDGIGSKEVFNGQINLSIDSKINSNSLAPPPSPTLPILSHLPATSIQFAFLKTTERFHNATRDLFGKGKS